MTAFHNLKNLADVFNHNEVLNALPEKVKQAMAPESVFLAPSLYPVFGANLFPIHYVSTFRDKDEEKAVLKELIQARKQLTKEACDYWNKALNFFQNIPVPHHLTGECIKNLQGVTTTIACKATPDKWSCNGCGKSWVPGSYVSKTCKTCKTCKKHEAPFWQEFLQEEIDELIKKYGTSETAPLVWVQGDASRLFKPKVQKAPPKPAKPQPFIYKAPRIGQ